MKHVLIILCLLNYCFGQVVPIPNSDFSNGIHSDWQVTGQGSISADTHIGFNVLKGEANNPSNGDIYFIQSPMFYLSNSQTYSLNYIYHQLDECFNGCFPSGPSTRLKDSNGNIVYSFYNDGINPQVNLTETYDFNDLLGVPFDATSDEFSVNTSGLYYIEFWPTSETEFHLMSIGLDPFFTNGSNRVQGNLQYDLMNNGCTSSGSTINQRFGYTINNGSNTISRLTNSSSDYSSDLIDGNYTFSVINFNPTIYNISPATFTVNFPGNTSPYTQDFCISKASTNPDLEIKIVPLTTLAINRPGFNSKYKIIVRNTGTETHSGNFNFVYDDNVMDFVSATGSFSPSTPTGVITWNFNNLNPLQSIEEEVEFLLNRPTHPTNPLNIGDIVTYTANVDDTSVNNSDVSTMLSQPIVNAYDPNDKVCLQGDTVASDIIGEYVDYVIRFENLGNADAINVVVKDVIDTSKFDISTLQVVSSNYNLRTEIKNGNEVEFIFENINLPPSPDAPSQPIIGYVAFKIKTLNALVAGDSFSNQADIFFDFNQAIVTNNFQTTIDSVLSVSDVEDSKKVTIYPNPASDFIQIATKEIIKNVQIFDVNGRLVQSSLNPNSQVDVSRLGKGIYVVQINTEKGKLVKKLIKE